MKVIGCAQIRHRGRIWAIIAAVAFLALAARLFWIQILHHETYYQDALEIQGRTWPIEAPRGNIYDRHGNPLALNLKVYSVAADPKLIAEPSTVAAQLEPLLRLPQADLQRKLTAKERVRWVRLQESVDQPAAEAIRNLECDGLIVDTDWKRAYPHGTLAASVLGFVGRDGHGLGGIEQMLDADLGGEQGQMLVALDGRLPRSRAQIPGRSVITSQMVPGSSVVLTLDLDIQAIAEEELAAAVEQANAAGGTAIVMDPNTGEVLALACQPGFDPNEFWRYPKANWTSHAVTSPYEPGSTFKVITACAAIEEGVMANGETYTCTGTKSIGARTVSCAQHGGKRDHGTVDLDDIIVHSCNTGVATVALELGARRLHEWVERFGFGEETGIELAGESRGILSSPNRWSQMRVANLGFGQGIGVTPLQLLSAYSAVANGGWRVKPRLVRAVSDPLGEIAYREPPQTERILSAETAARMRRVMTSVVEEGTGKTAQIPGRLVAGKTGTAQKPTPEAGFRSGKYIGSFAGFVPADDPKLACIVVIDEPRNGHYGAVVAAPAFRAICERALTRLRVPPNATRYSTDVRVARVVP
ncbi:MAG: penicillin-binding protein 2 [Armatimonadetes bacterium]|nr:penicillin-binding protein 2 [Armatimonadota bacterium]